MGNVQSIFNVECCAERSPHVPLYGRLSGERSKGACVNGCGFSVTWNTHDHTCCRSCMRKPGTDIFLHGPGCDQLPTKALVHARWREQQRIREAQRLAQLTPSSSQPPSPRSSPRLSMSPIAPMAPLSPPVQKMLEDAQRADTFRRSLSASRFDFGDGDVLQVQACVGPPTVAADECVPCEPARPPAAAEARRPG